MKRPRGTDPGRALPLRGGVLLDKTLSPGASRPEHIHPESALTLTLGGTYAEEFEQGMQLCSPLDLQFKPAGTPHDTRAGDGGGRLAILALEPGSPQRWPVLASLDRAVRIEPGAASVTAAVLHACAVGDGVEGRSARLEALLRSLELHLAANRAKDRPDWVEAVARRLGEEPSARHSLRDFARELDLHPVYVARVFRRSFGCSIGDYVRRKRCDRAARLLLGGERALAAMALDLGYADQAHFSRAFARETGCSPGRFRSLVRPGS